MALRGRVKHVNGSMPPPRTPTMSPMRWQQLRATCTRRLAADATDVDWHQLHSTCDGSRWCNVTDLAVGNFRPIVSTIDKEGLVTGVLYPGYWHADFWDDGWEVELGSWRPQRRVSAANCTGGGAAAAVRRGSNLLRRVRILTVRNAVVTSKGGVLARGRRFGVAPLRRCGLELPDNSGNHRGEHSVASCARPLGNVLVLQQLWSDSFSHIFFQLLPQLVLLLEHTATPAAAATSPLAAPYVILGPRQSYSSPSLPQLLMSGLGIDAAHLVRDSNGEAFHAQRASLLQLPPGVCAHSAIYGHGSLRHVHSRLRLAGAKGGGSIAMLESDAESSVRDWVVYFRRPCPMKRCVVNEPALLRAMRAALVAPFELRVINTGRSHTGDELGDARGVRRRRAAGGEDEDEEDVMGDYRDHLRAMRRARVIISVCGSAWGNAFFADAGAETVHFVEVRDAHSNSQCKRRPMSRRCSEAPRSRSALAAQQLARPQLVCQDASLHWRTLALLGTRAQVPWSARLEAAVRQQACTSAGPDRASAGGAAPRRRREMPASSPRNTIRRERGRGRLVERPMRHE